MIGNGVNGLGIRGKVKSRVQTAGKIMLLAFLMLSRTLYAYSEASGLLLRYDDGGAECFWSDYYPNGIAVRFTPPTSHWRITAILIYGFAIERSKKSFIVEVKDSNFNTVFRASYSVFKYFKNATLDWTRIPLPNVVVKDDFYVCIYPLLEFNGTQLWIAMDNDTASDRSFLIDCYKQELRKYDGGIAMMRVEGEEAVEIVEIVVDSISVKEEVLRLSFKVVSPDNITEAKAILQTTSLTEDCILMHEHGLYSVILNWSMLSGLKEPARLTLSVRTLNSTSHLTIKLSETLFSNYLRLKDENKLFRVMLNSFRLEQESLKHRLENREADVIALKALLQANEKKYLSEVEEAGKLAEDLNLTRFLTASLALSTALLLIAFMRQRLECRPLRTKEVGKNA